MKKIITLTSIVIFISCKSETKEDHSTNAKNQTKQEASKSSNSSADYSSLFYNYTCDVSSAELAKVIQLPVSDIKILESYSADNCVFQLKGFGAGYEDTGTTLRFMPVPSSKKQNKKEIATYLKYKNEIPSGALMDIVLADADDCYIAFQPGHGRALILNENYDNFFIITYGSKASVQGRSKEQQDQLKLKAKDLANYLVATHKK